MTYNTTSKRIIGSAQILEDIKNYDSNWNNFLKTEGMFMSQYITSNNSAADGYNRQLCLDKLGAITDNFKELKYLDNYIMDDNSWTRTTTISINNYVPYATIIQDGQGNTYDDGITDMSIGWTAVKQYSPARNGWLQEGQSVWDDDYSRKRNIIKQNNIYGKVIKDVDVNTSEDNWGNICVSQDKTYEWVMTDSKITEYESSDEPLVPSYKVFMGLVHKSSGNTDNLLSYISSAEYTLSCFNGTATNRAYYNKMKFKKSDISNGFLTFKLYGTKEYVEDIKNTIGKLVFFSNGNNFASCTVMNTEIRETPEEIKQTFAGVYKDAQGFSKQYVYDNKTLKDYYWSWEYEINILLLVNYEQISGNVELTARPTINGASIIKYTKNLKECIDNCLFFARLAYNNGGSMREEEMEPSYNYDKFIQYCNNSDVETTNGCLQFLRYIVSDMKVWVTKRAKALYNATNNANNAKALVNIISKRFNKSTGSFMQCYGSILSLDSQYVSIKNDKSNINTSGLFVVNAYTLSADAKCYMNQEVNTNYIDTENLDTRFYKSSNKFKAGDEVYIVGDGCVEFHSTVKSVSRVGFTVSDFEKASMKEDGSVDDILTTKEYKTRIFLNNTLPDYYCKGAKTSNIRVMKLIQS